jgi:hypothetical protein
LKNTATKTISVVFAMNLAVVELLGAQLLQVALTIAVWFCHWIIGWN